MIRRSIALSIALAWTTAATAETVLIRNARVHTVDVAGTLEASDVLIRDGKVARNPKVQAAAGKAQDVTKEKVTDAASSAADKVGRTTSIQSAP